MYKIVHALISHSHSIVIGRYYRICRFSFFITMFLHRISYYNIEYNSFSGRNSQNLTHGFFVEPPQHTTAQSFGSRSQNNMCCSYSNIDMRKMLPLDPASQTGRDISTFLNNNNMYRSLFGKVVNVQYTIRCRICYTIFQLRIIDYDKMPRLRITG